jgi:thioesterase domain-containing protein
MERQLVQLWEDALHVRPVGIRHNFFELGGDSLLAARLVAHIATRFGRQVTIGSIFEAPTVEQLAKRLLDSDAAHERHTSAVVEIHGGGTKPPLFLVHGMGGGMLWGYANLSRHLGPDQPVYALSSRGLNGEDEFGTIEEMAAYYVAELQAFKPEGPYHLGGYCFGGNVAQEMARLLAAQGAEVALLALFNCPARAPSYRRIRVTPRFCVEFLRNAGRRARHVLSLGLRRQLDFVQWKARAVGRKCQRLLRSNREENPFDATEWEDLSRLPDDRQKLWATHIRAYLAHQSQPYDGNLTLFRTSDHELICSFDEAYGWRELSRAVTIRMVPGAHQSIFEEPHVEALARAVQASLANSSPVARPNRVRAEAPPPELVQV